VDSLLVRDVRLVPVMAGDEVPDATVDVLVEGGTVTAVDAGVVRQPGVEELAAGGRWLIPGLWDQHVHLGQVVAGAERLDMAGARSPEDAVRSVAGRLAEQPGQPVIGWGHRSAGWQREGTTSELDALAPDIPVVLISGDAHHAWLNATAMAQLGLAPRDGVVREAEWFATYPRLVALVGADATSPQAYRRCLDAAAALGVVGLVDFEVADGPAQWSQRWAQGCDRLRIRASTYADTLERVIADGLRTGDTLPGCDERATMGPLKIISDGSLNTRTAWCCEPYADTRGLEHPYGAPNLSVDDLHDLHRRAEAAGLEVATHAIGDAAVAAALTACAETGSRGSIEHAQLVGRDDVRRMSGLGLRASVQPAHLLDDRDLTDRVWGDRSGRSFAFRWMLDDGVSLGLGSDAPVSPLDPWLAMAAAVHRGGGDREPWHPEQALSPREALAASVDGQPTVRPGSRGDLVLLDADPLAPYPGAAGSRTCRSH
jgi:predicted amidohydrolase YtcJ